MDWRAIWLAYSAPLQPQQVLSHLYLDQSAHFCGCTPSYFDWTFILALVHAFDCLNCLCWLLASGWSLFCLVLAVLMDVPLVYFLYLLMLMISSRLRQMAGLLHVIDCRWVWLGVGQLRHLDGDQMMHQLPWAVLAARLWLAWL